MTETNELFRFHKLTEEGQAHAVTIAEAFNDLVNAVDHLCPHCREYSLAMTKLEEACFFVKKAMAKANVAPED